jgi:uncharacterized protein DUF2017
VAYGFRPTAEGVVLRLPEFESGLLAELVGQIDDMYQPPPVADPLEALVGLRDSAPPPPEDPAVARLLPDPYPDDPAASADYRRRTYDDLLARKRSAAQRVLAQLPAPGEATLISEDAAQDWLTTLNDLRLVLGTRLGVTDEESSDDLERMASDEPTRAVVTLYMFLAELIDQLVRALSVATGLGSDDDLGDVLDSDPDSDPGADLDD